MTRNTAWLQTRQIFEPKEPCTDELAVDLIAVYMSDSHDSSGGQSTNGDIANSTANNGKSTENVNDDAVAARIFGIVTPERKSGGLRDGAKTDTQDDGARDEDKDDTASDTENPEPLKLAETKGKKAAETMGKKAAETMGKKVAETMGKKVTETMGKKVAETKVKKVAARQSWLRNEDMIRRELPIARIVGFELRINEGTSANVDFAELAQHLGTAVKEWKGSGQWRTTVFICHGYGCVLAANMFAEAAKSEKTVEWARKLLSTTAATCLFGPPVGSDGREGLQRWAVEKLGVSTDHSICKATIDPYLWKKFRDCVTTEDCKLNTKVIARIYKAVKDKATGEADAAETTAKAQSTSHGAQNDQEKASGAHPSAQKDVGSSAKPDPEPSPEPDPKELFDHPLPFSGREFGTIGSFSGPHDLDFKKVVGVLLSQAILEHQLFSAINGKNESKVEALLQANRFVDVAKIRNRSGESLLTRAILTGSTEIMRRLLSKRRFAHNISGIQGLKAIAAVIGDMDQDHAADKKERVELLLKSGAGVKVDEKLAEWVREAIPSSIIIGDDIQNLLEHRPPQNGPSAPVLLRTDPGHLNDDQLQASKNTKISVRQFIAATAKESHLVVSGYPSVARLLYGQGSRDAGETAVPNHVQDQVQAHAHAPAQVESQAQPQGAAGNQKREAVDMVLESIDSQFKITKKEAMCRWYHIPANNVSVWVSRSKIPVEVHELMQISSVDGLGSCR